MTRIELGDAVVEWTDASSGNLGHLPPRREHDEWCCGHEAVQRRRNVHPREWLYPVQVHGDTALVVRSGSPRSGAEADALVTDESHLTLAVATADCAPVALGSPEGVIAAVHAGWRGLVVGVIESAVQQMRSLGASEIHAALGPCIHRECYEFDELTLQDIRRQFGDNVVSSTQWGSPALDMVEVVRAVCDRAEVKLQFVHDACTACDTSYFSHRARADEGRQVMLVWRDGEDKGAR